MRSDKLALTVSLIAVPLALALAMDRRMMLLDVPFAAAIIPSRPVAAESTSLSAWHGRRAAR